MFKKIGFILVAYLLTSVAYATTFSERPDVQTYINQIAQQYHFNPKQLDAWFNTVTIQQPILDSINSPHEKKPWDVYQTIFLQEKRIQDGIAFSKKYQTTLDNAEKKYGVPAPIIVAILGVETYYGNQQGNYRVLDALSTLSFNYPARAPFFKKELTEFFLLCRDLDLNPTTVQGSYAGAIGQAQFMPSSYRHYAIDTSGDGRSDLRKNPHDAIYSIGNYLKQNGWLANEPIATPAKITRSDYKQINVDATKPLYTLKQFNSWGVFPTYYPPVMPQKPIGLIQLDTSTGIPEYWIGFSDFYVITRYNVSKQYAMAVFLLAAEIQRGMGITQ